MGKENQVEWEKKRENTETERSNLVTCFRNFAVGNLWLKVFWFWFSWLWWSMVECWYIYVYISLCFFTIGFLKKQDLGKEMKHAMQWESFVLVCYVSKKKLWTSLYRGFKIDRHTWVVVRFTKMPSFACNLETDIWIIMTWFIGTTEKIFRCK